MSYLLILRRVRVENANAIAGLTYGFPAISHFLGYTHALSRKLGQSHGVTLNQCGVICHDYQVHAHQAGWDKLFALTRNPLTKEAKTAAFNEEGRMHMTVSLLIECSGTIPHGAEGAKALEQHLRQICPIQRLAGGIITDIGQISVIAFPQEEQAVRQVMRRLLPGFALLDRSELLVEHYQRLQQNDPQMEMIDAWLDFAALKMQAQAPDAESAALLGAPASWHYIGKPERGYLVPLMTGYRAISPLYPAGQVENTRDPHTPFCFTEAVYGVGEWCSLHRIHDIHQLFWGYHHAPGGYLCRQPQPAADDFAIDDIQRD